MISLQKQNVELIYIQTCITHYCPYTIVLLRDVFHIGLVIPLLINQSNISREFSLQLSKRLVDSDLAVIEPTGIGPIWKISVLDWFLLYWPNESFYIVLTDLTIYRLINQS